MDLDDTVFKKKHDFKSACPQVAPIYPANNATSFHEINKYISGAYINKSISLLSQAVTYPTVSYDDLGVVPINETDPNGDARWNTRFAFIKYLEDSFPLLHQQLKLEKINTFGLLYTWQGSNETLKPTLLMAHTDVVPVPEQTVGQWTHPPFSGFFDGSAVWGRGASDCKNQLIAIMEAVTLLLEAKYVPQRTVLMSFGFDEEISGGEGAGSLAPFVHKRYGDDGIEVIIDEGNGFSESWGAVFASPAVGEKGHINVEITIRMPGGHSSVPSDHTAIGVSAELITLIENDKYTPELTSDNPYLAHLICGAAHAPKYPKKYKKLLRKVKDSFKLAKEVAKTSLGVKYLMSTSVAVDVINGGVKVNALPEEVKTVINHRVNIGSKTASVERKITSLARKIAKKHGLSVIGFGETDEGKTNTIVLSANNVLEPAPITPTASDQMPYRVVAGTTRALFGEHIIVSPGEMTGNTDTRYYWPLSKHIFRYNPSRGRVTKGGSPMGKIHTVDESQDVQGHLESVSWFWGFIMNMDVAR